MRLEDLPQLPSAEWPPRGSAAWSDAEILVDRGYQFKCKDACRLKRVRHERGWMDPETGMLAAELGVPVHQALFVASMRHRAESS